jgi:hypothetical protein
MSNALKKTLALAFSIVLLLSFVLWKGCGSYRVKSAWELPQGYRGWVLVEEANPKCPPAKFTFTTVVFNIDSTGHACTSTRLSKGPQFLTFWEIDSKGQRHELHTGSSGDSRRILGFSDAQASNESVKIREATEFFVGTEAEYHTALKSRPKWWLERLPVN